MSGQVQLEELAIEQLSQIKQQLDEELSHLSDAYSSLKTASAKFVACREAVDAINSSNKDKTLLIPLTSSLYVKGKLLDSANVLVDIGTGYYVEKSPKAAKTLYNTKILAIQANLKRLQETIETKDNNLMSVIQVMKQKMGQMDVEMAKAKELEASGRKAVSS